MNTNWNILPRPEWESKGNYPAVYTKEDGKDWELYYVADDEDDAIIAAASVETTNPNLSVKIVEPGQIP